MKPEWSGVDSHAKKPRKPPVKARSRAQSVCPARMASYKCKVNGSKRLRFPEVSSKWSTVLQGCGLPPVLRRSKRLRLLPTRIHRMMYAYYHPYYTEIDIYIYLNKMEWDWISMNQCPLHCTLPSIATWHLSSHVAFSPVSCSHPHPVAAENHRWKQT